MRRRTGDPCRGAPIAPGRGESAADAAVAAPSREPVSSPRRRDRSGQESRRPRPEAEHRAPRRRPPGRCSSPPPRAPPRCPPPRTPNPRQHHPHAARRGPDADRRHPRARARHRAGRGRPHRRPRAPRATAATWTTPRHRHRRRRSGSRSRAADPARRASCGPRSLPPGRGPASPSRAGGDRHHERAARRVSRAVHVAAQAPHVPPVGRAAVARPRRARHRRRAASRCRSAPAGAGSARPRAAPPRGGRFRLARPRGRRRQPAASASSPAGGDGLSRGNRGVGRLRVYRTTHASWYGPGLYGSRSPAAGTLQPGTLGVANKTLPCGTKVTLRHGGRSVTRPGDRPRPVRRAAASTTSPPPRPQRLGFDGARRDPRHALSALAAGASSVSCAAFASSPRCSRAATRTPSSRTGRVGAYSRSSSSAVARTTASRSFVATVERAGARDRRPVVEPDLDRDRAPAPLAPLQPLAQLAREPRAAAPRAPPGRRCRRRRSSRATRTTATCSASAWSSRGSGPGAAGRGRGWRRTARPGSASSAALQRAQRGDPELRQPLTVFGPMPGIRPGEAPAKRSQRHLAAEGDEARPASRRPRRPWPRACSGRCRCSRSGRSRRGSPTRAGACAAFGATCVGEVEVALVDARPARRPRRGGARSPTPAREASL